MTFQHCTKIKKALESHNLNQVLCLLTSFLLEDIIFNKKFKQKFGNPQAEGFNYYSSTRLDKQSQLDKFYVWHHVPIFTLPVHLLVYRM